MFLHLFQVRCGVFITALLVAVLLVAISSKVAYQLVGAKNMLLASSTAPVNEQADTTNDEGGNRQASEQYHEWIGYHQTLNQIQRAQHRKGSGRGAIVRKGRAVIRTTQMFCYKTDDSYLYLKGFKVIKYMCMVWS